MFSVRGSAIADGLEVNKHPTEDTSHWLAGHQLGSLSGLQLRNRGAGYGAPSWMGHQGESPRTPAAGDLVVHLPQILGGTQYSFQYIHTFEWVSVSCVPYERHKGPVQSPLGVEKGMYDFTHSYEDRE